jgi:two-component system KDP operon response regulator KdpE
MASEQSGSIHHQAGADRFFRGQTELTELSAQDRRLLGHFLAHAAALQTIDDLIGAAWTEYDSSGVSNAAVQQAIRHLRTQIEPDPSRPRYLVTERGRGYRFFPEGAPGT